MPETTKNGVISLTVEKDFLQRVSSTGAIKALAELIWNGLDSGSDSVQVEFSKNKLGAIDEIRVIDQGSGISYEESELFFGKLGDSWKKNHGKVNGRALHGKNGQGRLHAFALGSRVTWKTTYKVKDSFNSYQIVGDASSLNRMHTTTPKETNKSHLGTTVVISGISEGLGALTSDKAPTEFAKLFAAYLSQYPQVSIILDGETIDPASIQRKKEDRFIKGITLANGNKVDAMVTIIEWAVPTPRAIHLCDKAGVSLHTTDAGIQAPGFQFTAYVNCDHFRELDKENLLSMDDLVPDVNCILNSARNELRGYFRKRTAERARSLVQRWKTEKIYPYEDQGAITAVEETERQVFDILGVTLEEYLPKFEEADHNARKFTFLLLAQALRDNPSSVRKIITDVLSLKQDEQDELAELLEETPLSNIISSASIVANRLNFLVALENLLFDKTTKKKLLERDQLHKILETESWIFDDNFTLAGSEETLEDVLKIHLSELGKREDSDAEDKPVLREDDQQGRVDLMLSRTIQPREDEYDHLIVELKRPSQKISSKVLGQIESYAIAVAKDPRFLTDKTRWKFIAVSNDMDEHAKRKARQRDKPRGMVFDDGELNIEVWAFEWTEIIANARTRLQFINQSLDYKATRDSSRAYLEKAHAKFLPATNQEDQKDIDEESPQ
ncbi:ATP-binding protein [Verrucomicrobiaceae bacterium 5K15]|uniref:ATP-binding protein n=1 Tax=Oceaniferula flava TaxID=2800421 RepID=A0AAE2VBK4_9BACT|nr:ATP-binding protein [Oceaniferula flavus]MBK1854625.1 ATP-binding protein [Oceaniferula flavus]MBM1135931.1 ATP-binding protein [Oceaniferula flavus]